MASWWWEGVQVAQCATSCCLFVGVFVCCVSCSLQFALAAAEAAAAAQPSRLKGGGVYCTAAAAFSSSARSGHSGIQNPFCITNQNTGGSPIPGQCCSIGRAKQCCRKRNQFLSRNYSSVIDYKYSITRSSKSGVIE